MFNNFFNDFIQTNIDERRGFCGLVHEKCELTVRDNIIVLCVCIFAGVGVLL